MNTVIRNFTALAPPDWLKEDMARMAQILPNVRTLIAFRNEISGSAPDEHMQFLLQNAYGMDPATARRMAQDASGNETAACLAHDAPRNERLGSCPVTRLSEARTAILAPPRHALIMLPNSQISSATLIRTATRLTAVRPDAGNFHRSALWHEFGHLRMAALAGATIRARLDEQNADLSVGHGCRLAQDKASLHSFMQWRVVSNFTSQVTDKASIYWNDLSLLGIKDATEADSMASLLELKLRAAGGTPHTPDPANFTRKAMIDPRYGKVRGAFNAPASPERLIQQVAEQHYRPYTFRHTRTLAEFMLNAAQKISPLAF